MQGSVELQKRISKKPLIVDEKTQIRDVVKLMMDKGYSSALIKNDRLITGICTERDILRKISTLDLDAKMTFTINTIMTRGIRFVREAYLIQDLKILHDQTRNRHFPVVSNDEPISLDNIVGMLTVTDLARLWLDQRT